MERPAVRQVDSDTWALTDLGEWGGVLLPGLVARQVSALRRLLGAPACSVALAVGPRSLRFCAASGAGARGIVGVDLPTDRGLAGWAASSGQSLTLSDVERDPRFARDVAEATGYVPRRVTAVPLPGREGSVGVLEVLDAEPDPLAVADSSLALGSLAAGLAALVESLREGGEDPRVAAVREGAARLAEANPEAFEALVALLAALDSPRSGRWRR